ncbi:MAG TPA: protein translocase subunit SecD [Firmicutes bacterium]|nr:protein translocase subunit SecD [Bacillota bacterium]
MSGPGRSKLFRLGFRVKARILLVALLIVIAGSTFYLTRVNPILARLNQGLDLKGGLHVVLEAVSTPEAPVTKESVDAAQRVIEHRVNLLGVTEPDIQRSGNRIIMELPGVNEPEKAAEIVGKTALLEFKDESGKTLLTGKDLANADVGTRGTQPVVLLEFNSEGAKKFAEATTNNVNKRILITLDGELISFPLVTEPITGGNAEITGYTDMRDAYNLAVLLKSGALPVKLDTVETWSVSAMLGQDSINKSKLAAVVGIGAVMLFMLLYYRLSGLIADVALLVYMLITLAVLVLIKATLTLPGIAGLILSVGMAVDANVLIFERIKEELRGGRTLKSAIATGFSRALVTIVDSNLTTLIAVLVLFFLTSGPVRGFSLTLGIGVLASMFTAISVTRWLLTLSVDSGLLRNSLALFGVTEVSAR